MGIRLDFSSIHWKDSVDGLREQNQFIEHTQLELAWEHFVHAEFQRINHSSKAMHRRREVALSLGLETTPIRKQTIPDLTSSLARLYAKKTSKTLTRDMNWLVERGFLERKEDGYRAKVELMHAFRPARA